VTDRGQNWEAGAPAAALLGGAGIALLANRVAVMTGIVHEGAWGGIVARFDLAPAVLIVVAAYLVSIPYASARTTDEVRAAARRSLQAVGALYVAWWLTMLVVSVVVHPVAGARRWLATAVLFRDPRDSPPILGLGIGPVLLTIALTALGVPLLARFVRGDRRKERIAIAVLGALGVGYRLVVIASGRTSANGPLGWPIAHLDLVAAGLAIALLQRADLGAAKRLLRPVAGGGAAVLFLVAAFGIGLGRDPVQSTDWTRFAQPMLALAVASGLVIFVCFGGPRAVRPVVTAATALAVVAPGVILLGEASLVLVARRYRIEVIESPAGLQLQGPAIGPFLWALVISAAFGVVLTAIAVCCTHPASDRWRVPTFPLALATVTSLALLVRVFGLIGVSPERTDGGDPLYYHTTANLLANGRGFPEPLNWIAHATTYAGAVHGPLYPMVLSFTSRLGATDWFDHKMLSVLIGTAVVLVTALLARRLAGEVAAVVAGLFAAFYPNLWLIDGVLFPEGLFALCTTLAALLAYRYRDRPSVARSMWLGAVIGLATLTRGEGLLLVPLLVVPWVLRTRSRPANLRWRDLLLGIVACVGVVAPWSIRNAIVFDKFVPLSTNSNELIVYANCVDTYSGKFLGYWSYDCQQRIRDAEGDPPGDQSEQAAAWREIGVDYAKDHLNEVPKVLAARVGRQWELFRPIQNVQLAGIEGRDQTYGRLGLWAYYLLVAGSVFGLLDLRRRRRAALAAGSDGSGDGASTWPLIVQFVSVTLTALYAYGTIRFRAPAEPMICVLAAVGVAPWVGRFVRWAQSLRVPDDRPHGGDGQAFVLGGTGGLRSRSLGAWRTWAGVAVVVAVVALPLRGLYNTSGATMEEAFMLYFPERLGKGDIPNVDFLHLYGPGSLYALLGWYKLFGFTLDAERTFGLLQHLGIIFGLFTLARAWGRTAATIVASIAAVFVLTQVGLTAMAWNGGLALGLWATIFALRARMSTDARSARRCWIAAGVLAGFAVSFRPDLVIALGLMLAWMLWRRRPAWLPVLIGLVIGVVPLLVHVAMAGPSAAFRGMVIDPVFHLRSGRELPAPPSWGHLDGALQAVAEQFPPWWGLPAIAPSRSLFLWFFLMLGLAIGLPIAGWVLYRRTNGSRRSIVIIAASLFSLGTVSQGMQRPDSTHLSWVTCISWPLLVVVVIELLRTRAPRAHPQARALVAGVVVAASVFAIAPLYTARGYVYDVRLGLSLGDVPRSFLLRRGDRTFFLGDYRPYNAAVQAIADLDRLSTPGQRLFVGPSDLRRTWYSDVFFYYLFPELVPATYYIEMDPGLANKPGSRLAGDVASADWIILTGYWDGWLEPNSSMDYGSDAPNEVIRDQFCLYQNYGDGQVLLYYRCDEPPSGLEETGG
jgi:4-amino-4-deoxy-L-arabinose transferase-like glycosyltransferase